MGVAAPLLCLAALLCGCASPPAVADPASDAPEARHVRDGLVPIHPTYESALAAWRAPEDVNAWIGARFEYDFGRAAALSESQRALAPAPSIYEPRDFYDRPSGVCVDLARFAVETLRQVAPDLRPRYLMIEFHPATVSGQLLRRHWLAAFEREGGHYFFADSKRPGTMAGPYPSVSAFVAEYARFRGREIVAYRELETYRRQQKAVSRRKPGGD